MCQTHTVAGRLMSEATLDRSPHDERLQQRMAELHGKGSGAPQKLRVAVVHIIHREEIRTINPRATWYRAQAIVAVQIIFFGIAGPSSEIRWVPNVMWRRFWTAFGSSWARNWDWRFVVGLARLRGRALIPDWALHGWCAASECRANANRNYYFKQGIQHTLRVLFWGSKDPGGSLRRNEDCSPDKKGIRPPARIVTYRALYANCLSSALRSRPL